MDVFVGIDVSKDRLDICVRPSGRLSPSRVTTKAWSILSSACARFILCWSRSRRRADTTPWSQARLPPRICRSR